MPPTNWSLPVPPGQLNYRRLEATLMGIAGPSYFRLFDDFVDYAFTAVGQYGRWLLASSVAGVPSSSSIAGHPGGMRLNGTNETATAICPPSASVGTWFWNDQSMPYDLRWNFRTGSAVTTVTYRLGMGLDPTANPPADGIYIERLSTDTNWFGVCRAGGVQTRVDTGVVGTFNTFYWFRIRMVGDGTIGFTVSGGDEKYIATNITSAALNLMVQMINAAATARSITVDAVELIGTGLIR